MYTKIVKLRVRLCHAPVSVSIQRLCGVVISIQVTIWRPQIFKCSSEMKLLSPMKLKKQKQQKQSKKSTIFLTAQNNSGEKGNEVV